jgi:hypothetical protein
LPDFAYECKSILHTHAKWEAGRRRKARQGRSSPPPGFRINTASLATFCIGEAENPQYRRSAPFVAN